MEPGHARGRDRELLDAIFAPLPAERGMETAMSYETILVEQSGAVTLITLNRPQGAQRAQLARCWKI